jgi:hypothetical protein
MQCEFCGTCITKNLSVQSIGIAFGMAGFDYSFCAKCLHSMSAYQFWKKIAHLRDYKFPLHIK